jgi:MinD-like ATPase involved in chromosome partitioning or flagellar assembly
MVTSTRAPHVVGVLGASGGLGASTLAVALAGSAVTAHPPVVCVDGHLERGGLDVTACVEHLPGVRWGDLAGVRGEVVVADLLRELPRAGGVPVLSAASGGVVPPLPVVGSVLESLTELAGLVVVDLSCGPSGEPFLAACGVVVLLCGVSPRHLADAASVRSGVTASGTDVRLVVRGAPRGDDLPQAIATSLDLPLAGTWREDRQVRLDAERGRPPGQRPRSALASLCGRLLEQAAAGEWAS